MTAEVGHAVDEIVIDIFSGQKYVSDIDPDSLLRAKMTESLEYLREFEYKLKLESVKSRGYETLNILLQPSPVHHRAIEIKRQMMRIISKLKKSKISDAAAFSLSLAVVNLTQSFSGVELLLDPTAQGDDAPPLDLDDRIKQAETLFHQKGDREALALVYQEFKERVLIWLDGVSKRKIAPFLSHPVPRRYLLEKTADFRGLFQRIDRTILSLRDKSKPFSEDRFLSRHLSFEIHFLQKFIWQFDC